MALGPALALALARSRAQPEESENRPLFLIRLEWTRAFNAREVSWLRVSGFGLGGFERPFETIFEV